MIKPITERCVSVAHMMPIADTQLSNYWLVRRMVHGVKEALVLESEAHDKDEIAKKMAAKLAARLLNDFNLTCYQNGGEYIVEVV